MSVKRRIGNDIPFKWAVYRGDEAEDFTGKTLRLYVREVHGKTQEITGFTTDGNIISFTWHADEQLSVGVYTLILKEFGNDGALCNTIDIKDAVTLVPHTFMEDGDSDYIDDGGVSFRSDFDVVFNSIDKAYSAAQTAVQKGEEADVKSQSLSELMESAQYIHDNLERLLDDYYQSFGNGVIPHDHEGQLIRPAVLCIPTLAPTDSYHIKDGEICIYFDRDSAVDGETPQRVGGTDVEWVESGKGYAGLRVGDVSKDVSLKEHKHSINDIIDFDSTDCVTLSTEQIITAPKTFAEDATFGAAREDGSYSRLLIPSSSGPGIYDLYVSTEPVDGEVPSASGGIDEDELWTILGGSSTNKVIDPSHIPVIPVEKVSGLGTALASYATKEWVEGKGYLTSVSLSTISDLHSSWDSLLQSAPDFYSKSQVYSKSEADGRFVGIANEQTITGRKTFDKLLTASAGISGTNADLSGYISAVKVYLPYSGGNKVYDILISTQPIDGEAPSEGGGINEDELWSILGGSGTQKIGASHIPPLSELSGNLDSSRITGLDSALASYATQSWVTSQNYAVQTNDNNLISHSNEFNFIPAGFSNVVWFNFRAKGGTGSISQYVFARGSAVAGEYAELLGSNFIADEGPGFVKRMHTDTSNFETGPVWDNAAGTSHLAAIGYWNTPQKVFINPCYNEVTDAWDDAVGKHNFVVGKNFLTYNTYPILHSGNIGSYALTPSNYASTLDARYVKKAGDTMTGRLTITTSSDDILIFNDTEGEKYFRIKAKANGTDWGGLVLDGRSSVQNLYLGTTTAGYKVWHSGNDGSGSGLDADLLDGVHKSGLLTSLSSNATTNLLLTVGGTTKSISEFYAYQAVRLLVNDTRSDNNIPYNNGKGVYADFKYNSTDGWNYGGIYHAVIHINPWEDSSGGPCTQLAFGDDGSVGLRKSSGSSWGSWRRLLDTVNNIFTSGRLFIPSSSGNQVFDAYIA